MKTILSLFFPVFLLINCCLAQIRVGNEKSIEMILPESHGESVTEVLFSPDAERIVTIGGKMVKLWDRKSGMSLCNLASYEFWAGAIFSPKGNYILSSGGKTAYLSDGRNGRLIRELKGHVCTRIIATAFSPDEQWAATAGDNLENIIRIWRVPANEPPIVLSPDKYNLRSIQDLLFSADNRYLIVACNGNTLLLLDWRTGAVIDRKMKHSGVISSMAMSNNGKMLLTGGGEGMVGLWDMGDSLELRDTLQSLGYTYGDDRTVSHVEFSPDDRYFLFGSMHCMATYDIENEIRLHTWPGDMAFRYARFSPDGQNIISSDLRFFDFRTGKLVKTLELKSRKDAWPMGYLPHFSRDGKYLALPTAEGYVHCYETATGRLMFTVGNKYKGLKYCEISHSGHHLLIGEQLGAVKLGDLRTGQFHILPVRQSFPPQFSPDDHWVLTDNVLEPNPTGAFRGQSNLALWNTETGKPRQILNSDRLMIHQAGFANDRQVYGVPLDEKFMFVWDLKDDRRLKVDLLSNSVIFDKKSGALLSADDKYIEIYRFDDNSVRKFPRPPALTGTPVMFSATGKYVLFENPNRIFLYELSSGKIAAIDRIPPIINFSFDAADKKIAATNGKNCFLYDIDSQQKIYEKTQASISSGVLLTANGKTMLTFGWDNLIRARDAATGDSLFELSGHHGEVTGAKLTDHDSKLVTVSRDGLCFIWDLKTGKAIWKILVGSESDYLITADDQYFMGNRTAPKLAGWKVDDRVYSFEQLDLKYNRPDIVLRKLGYAPQSLIDAYYEAYLVRLDRLGFTETMLSGDIRIPELTVLSPDIPETVAGNEVSIQVRVSDSVSLLDCINVSVNGVPAFGHDGISLRHLKTRRVEKRIAIPLMYNPALKGDNRIQVWARNRAGGESFRETFNITRLPDASKPNRYIIAIGTNTFQYAADKNLDYAEKDAKAFADWFQSGTEDFNTTYVHLLLNREFTADKVKAIKAILSKTNPDDHVYIYCSTHGFRDAQASFFLAAFNTDFRQPFTTGLPYADLENLLDSIPAMNKLLFLDACFAGEIDAASIAKIKADNTFYTGDKKFKSFVGAAPASPELQQSIDLVKDLFIELRLGTGATVIAAAGGGQFAQEGGGWSNSVFAYTLLKGLKTRAADINKDGTILVSELQQYLANAVSAETGGWQKPVFRIENITNDFKVW